MENEDPADLNAQKSITESDSWTLKAVFCISFSRAYTSKL